MDISDEAEIIKSKKWGTESSIPRYQQIACDVASRIADGTYAEGTRIKGRSALAGQYGVSTETARRAICILSDLEIVKAVQGSGITVLSRDKAIAYLRNFQNVDGIENLKTAIRQSIERQQAEVKLLSKMLDAASMRIERFRSANPFVPYQVQVPQKCRLIGQNLQEINFWHNTLATIVGIRHGETIKLSPGPYADFHAGDVIYFIGEPSCVARVHAFLGAD